MIVPDMYHTNLYYNIYKEKQEDYWVKKRDIPVTALRTIDYDAIARGSKGQDLNKQRFVAKWISHCIGTGKNMVRWNMRHEGYCPFCCHANEDTKHILLCQHVDAIAAWEKALKQHLESLNSFDTCSLIIRIIRNE